MDKVQKPSEWNFNKLLLTISQDITDNELSTLKRMVVGNGILQESDVNEISSTIELFSCLRDMQYLNSKNVASLQKMLMVIKRKDLIKRAIEYCQQDREYEMMRPCIPDEEDLEPGHSYVRFYFDHLEMGDFNINLINYFRMRISTLLFIPVGDIIVAGLENDTSKCHAMTKPVPGVILTLMMPDLIVSILHDIVDDRSKLIALGLFGVKRVKIENKMYTLIEDDAIREKCNLLDVHKDLIHEQLKGRETQPEVWSKQMANKDQFCNTGELDNKYNERLAKLNQFSGMSITLWKNFGKLSENATKPHVSHDELQRQCMHAKLVRLYPQLTYDKYKETIDLSSKSEDQRQAPKLE